MTTIDGHLDSLDGLDEGLAKYYEQNGDGKFVLQIKGPQGWGYENVAGIKTALNAERDGRRKAVKHLSRYGEYDDKTFSFTPTIDPDEAASALERAAEFADNPPVGEDAVNALKAEFAAKEKRKTDKLMSEIEALKGQIDSQENNYRKLLVSDRSKSALVAAECLPEYIDLLQGHLEKVAQVVEQDGRRVVRLCGPDGVEIPTMASGSTEPMGYEEYIKVNMREKYPGAFKGSGATGSAATGTDRSGSKIDPKLPPEERIRLHYEKGGT
jgi:hypothetical protein